MRDRLPKEAGLFFSLIKDIISFPIGSFGGRPEPTEPEDRNDQDKTINQNNDDNINQGGQPHCLSGTGT